MKKNVMAVEFAFPIVQSCYSDNGKILKEEWI